MYLFDWKIYTRNPLYKKRNMNNEIFYSSEHDWGKVKWTPVFTAQQVTEFYDALFSGGFQCETININEYDFWVLN